MFTRKMTYLGLALLVLIFTQGPSHAEFQSCGFLAIDGECISFIPDPQSLEADFIYELDYAGPLLTFDTVYVEGTLDTSCVPLCPDVDGCITVSLIELCNTPEWVLFQSQGVLLPGGNCVLFAPYGDSISLFVLDNYGEFGVGDTVFVEGSLELLCQTSCTEAAGCILDNTIGRGYSEGSPIYGNAVIKFAAGAPVDSILEGSGVNVMDSIFNELAYLVSYNDSVSLFEFFHDLYLRPDVELIEPGYEFSVPENVQMSMSFPDELAPSHIPGSSPASFYFQDGVGTTSLELAHIAATGEGVRVAVIDNGFELDHSLLEPALETYGYDFLDQDSIPAPDSGLVTGHGTFVTGIVLLGAPDCRIIPLRAFNGDGIGNSFAVAQAIYFAIDHDVDIVNMSFGMYDPSYIVAHACSAAVAAGMTLVAAAGNDGQMMSLFPAVIPEVIGVMAIDTNEFLGDFSNFGPQIDVCAPGVGVYSSLAGLWEWGTWNGTSFSTPFVTATCALALSVDSSLVPAEMKSLIRSTARTDFEWGSVEPPDSLYSYGVIDAANAVFSLSPTLPICGDIDGNSSIDVDDIMVLVSYVFPTGMPPTPKVNWDVDCSEIINVDDIVYLVHYIFGNGPDPCCL